MAWKTDLVLMLRSLIGDLDQSKYTDERLKQILVVGAYNVLAEATFATTYTIDVGEVSISPDPISDTDFTTLVLYKSACILLSSEVKTEAGCAIAIKDGPSSVDLRSVSKTLIELHRHICAKYDELLQAYLFAKGAGDGTSPGAAVLSPYSPASFGLGGTHDTRYDFH